MNGEWNRLSRFDPQATTWRARADRVHRYSKQLAAAAIFCGIASFTLSPAAAEPSHDRPDMPGVLRLDVDDPLRKDPVQPKQVRAWQVDLYYPSAPATGSAAGPYAPDDSLLRAMQEDGYYHLSAQELGAWRSRRAPAVENAPPQAGAKHPLITLSPGFGVAAFNYSILASELVRRGFVVAVIDHPYLGIGRLRGGAIRRSSDDPLLRNDDQASWGGRIADWSRDVTVTLDALAARRNPAGALYELDGVTAVGHSLGGAIALDVCRVDRRVTSCADFEGAPFGTATELAGPANPTLFVLSRSLRSDRPPLSPDFGNPMFAFLTKSGNRSSWAVGVNGGSHMSFSDAPFVMPATLSQFGGTLMSPERSLEVYAGMVATFALAFRPGGGGDSQFSKYVETLAEARAAWSGATPAGTAR